MNDDSQNPVTPVPGTDPGAGEPNPTPNIEPALDQTPVAEPVLNQVPAVDAAPSQPAPGELSQQPTPQPAPLQPEQPDPAPEPNYAFAPPTPTKKKKPLLVIIVNALVLILCVGALAYFLLTDKQNNPEPTHQSSSQQTPASSTPAHAEGINIVPTFDDTINANSAWCGTFQLIWNDLKNEVVHQDIDFGDVQIAMVDNLNKGSFNTSMLSNDYYFKAHGPKTPALKTKIENGIKQKFSETSDILDTIDWSENGDYVLYAMLKRIFEYQYEFAKLDAADFGDYQEVNYFGLDGPSQDAARNQIEILYYDSADSFAIAINTKTGDEVIFVKNPEGDSFGEIYNNMNDATKKYDDAKRLRDQDTFKAPNLKLNEVRKYDELVGHPFPVKQPNSEPMVIIDAIQTIQLSLDEKGGSVRSEAMMHAATGMVEPPTRPEEPRYFNVDSTFALFIRQKGRPQPYFATRVDDITKYQPAS
ncbi:hypothetical protein FWF93_02765 [Candidatus Saccharibacteria bacterium]|nr:hypothetical protein [Candidatus Saccharibacteria bacterium]